MYNPTISQKRIGSLKSQDSAKISLCRFRVFFPTLAYGIFIKDLKLHLHFCNADLEQYLFGQP